MRWIFFTLVAANLLLLVVFWQQQNQSLASDDAPVAELQNKGRTLLLVSETDGALKPVQRKKTKQRSQEPLCYVAGPYAEELDARHLLARVKAVGLSGRIKTLEVTTEQPAEYWVHVPPRSGREEALRVLKELQKRNFDSYIITQGDLAEGVSLGLFRNKASAEGLREKVAAAGIPVRIRVVNESAREFWVEVNEVAQLNERMRERIQAGDADISWEMVECR
ncbi:MAG: hypothetical protein CMI02_20180 [Oceanospirillaceae bacterium]|nr:hypothetical protein [Oceanospirillaceae bacterium]MBT14348.1 hypothetical protein [Oceanospirillaceae bacterium]|tara:strand:+ start:6156 stop:6821 length:666 start_codon:yes stop_codon:yes gene_type:complete